MSENNTSDDIHDQLRDAVLDISLNNLSNEWLTIIREVFDDEKERANHIAKLTGLEQQSGNKKYEFVAFQGSRIKFHQWIIENLEMTNDMMELDEYEIDQLLAETIQLLKEEERIIQIGRGQGRLIVIGFDEIAPSKSTQLEPVHDPINDDIETLLATLSSRIEELKENRVDEVKIKELEQIIKQKDILVEEQTRLNESLKEYIAEVERENEELKLSSWN